MEKIAIAFSVWCVLGFLVGLFVDFTQMKQPVPYGEVPSGIPLPTIRFWVIVLYTLMGLPFVLKCAVSVLREHYDL